MLHADASIVARSFSSFHALTGRSGALSPLTRKRSRKVRIAATVSCFALGALISASADQSAHAQTGVLLPAPTGVGGARSNALPGGQAARTATTVVLPASYRIGPGDVLDISVFEKPELSRSISVPPDGRISFPFAGDILVGGLTRTEVSKTLTQRLAREISSPQVTINISRRQAQEVSILGPVRSPGKRILGDNWRLLELVSDSGGLTVAKPEWAAATLVRSGGASTIEIDVAKLMAGDPTQNILVEPNDILVVREVESTTIAIRVGGEVTKPSSIVVPKDGSLVSVIEEAGGFTPRAALARATLTRGDKVYTVDLRDLMNTGRAVIVADAPTVGPSVSTGLTTATGGATVGGKTPGVPGTPASAVTPLSSSTTTPGAPLPSAGAPLLPIGASIKAEPGDVLLIPQNRLLFAVQGAVNRPDVLNFPESKNVTVLSALSMAGGLSASANLKEASLMRPNEATGIPATYPINLDELLKAHGENDKRKKNKDGTEVRDLAMQPGDILYVPDKEPGKAKFGLRDALSYLPFLGYFAR